MPLSRAQAGLIFAGAALGVLLLLALDSSVSAATTAGLGLSLGGAAGNLLDRLRRGAVVDFIRLGRWPAFNVADAALVAGAGLVAASLV